MAFFSKPPAKKKPQVAKPSVQPRAAGAASGAQGVSAREIAAQAAKRGARPADTNWGSTVTGARLVPWSPAKATFEVAQVNPGLCAVLENAALRFASGQGSDARSLLEEGLANDAEAKLSPLAWLALFDLMQRDHDKAAFDRLSMEYVTQFESSAPAWEARMKPQAAPKALGGYVAVSGPLTAASEKQLEGLKRAVARRVESARLDLGSIQGFDDAGARLLADALGEARRAHIALQLQAGDSLVPELADALKKGRDAGEGAWLLALELLQWTHDREAFEERAIDFAVTFELSPPSWEPAQPVKPGLEPGAGEAPTNGHSADPEMLQWSGVLAGSVEPQIGKLSDASHDRSVIAVDMSEVERIDFVCANALVNAVAKIESQRKVVQMIGVSPIIRALLLLLGTSPRVFVKKSP